MRQHTHNPPLKMPSRRYDLSGDLQHLRRGKLRVRSRDPSFFGGERIESLERKMMENAKEQLLEILLLTDIIETSCLWVSEFSVIGGCEVFCAVSYLIICLTQV